MLASAARFHPAAGGYVTTGSARWADSVWSAAMSRRGPGVDRFRGGHVPFACTRRLVTLASPAQQRFCRADPSVPGES